MLESIREKINYYNNVIQGKVAANPAVKRKAKNRLKTLTRLNNTVYDEPEIVVTNDSKFGNPISKPRACVVIDFDTKGRVLVSPIEKRTSQSVILDKQIDRQIANKRKWIDRSEIYETKYISNL